MPQSGLNSASSKLRIFTDKHLGQIPQLKRLTADERRAIETVATVLPFRVNQYVLDELIDWDDPRTDPIFRLVFPQQGMLSETEFNEIRGLLDTDAPRGEPRGFTTGPNPLPLDSRICKANVLTRPRELLPKPSLLSLVTHRSKVPALKNRQVLGRLPPHHRRQRVAAAVDRRRDVVELRMPIRPIK